MSDDGYYWTVELEELFIKEFGNERTQKTDGSEIEVTEHEAKEVRPQ